MSTHIYFKGLKFIRFFAASLVVVHHIEQFKSIFGLQNLWENGTIRNLGDKGVSLFFVLSGFLITFLLQKEKEQTNTINIKYFYIRRILRIWSLYFLIVLASLFIFPQFSFFRMNGTSIIDNNLLYIFLLSLVILPNVTLFKFGAIPFSSQAWSIGVEEQFYLLWPWLIKYVNKISFVLIGIIVAMFVLQNSGMIIPKLIGKEAIDSSVLSKLTFFFKLFRIDCMAFGSIGALMVFYKSKFLKYFYHPVPSFLTLFFTILLIVNPFHILFFENIIQSILFMALILNIATNSHCFYSIENKIFNKLGDISYGIYMYHPLICFTVIKLVGDRINNVTLYFLIFSFTLLLAYLSYTVFEKKLIRIKSRKFGVIHSN